MPFILLLFFSINSQKQSNTSIVTFFRLPKCSICDDAEIDYNFAKQLFNSSENLKFNSISCQDKFFSCSLLGINGVPVITIQKDQIYKLYGPFHVERICEFISNVTGELPSSNYPLIKLSNVAEIRREVLSGKCVATPSFGNPIQPLIRGIFSVFSNFEDFVPVRLNQDDIAFVINMYNENPSYFGMFDTLNFEKYRQHNIKKKQILKLWYCNMSVNIHDDMQEFFNEKDKRFRKLQKYFKNIPYIFIFTNFGIFPIYYDHDIQKMLYNITTICFRLGFQNISNYFDDIFVGKNDIIPPYNFFQNDDDAKTLINFASSVKNNTSQENKETIEKLRQLISKGSLGYNMEAKLARRILIIQCLGSYRKSNTLPFDSNQILSIYNAQDDKVGKSYDKEKIIGNFQNIIFILLFPFVNILIAQIKCCSNRLKTSSKTPSKISSKTNTKTNTHYTPRHQISFQTHRKLENVIKMNFIKMEMEIKDNEEQNLDWAIQDEREEEEETREDLILAEIEMKNKEENEVLELIQEEIKEFEITNENF